MIGGIDVNYIEDVARRFAVEGFLSLAPDGLAPIGGYPGNDDDGKVMQKSLDKGKRFTDMLNSARFLKNHEGSNGKLGATGFCYGGGVVNMLAVTIGADLNARVPFYGGSRNLQPSKTVRNMLTDKPQMFKVIWDHKT